MEKKDLITQYGALSLASSTPLLTQLGDKNTGIAHADTVHLTATTNVFFTGMASGNAGIPTNAAMNYTYYNLIVMGGDEFEPFKEGHLLMSMDRALKEGISPEVERRFSSLSDSVLEQIKTFPALFATENHHHKRTDEDHQAMLGLVTGLVVQDNGVKIYYQTLNPIPQQHLNMLNEELGLGLAGGFPELNRSHWTIKKINLVEALKDAGLAVFLL